MSREQFWVLDHLTDAQLLEQLRSVLSRKRLTLAELVAHLGEVEERRLHLAAAHPSLFSYCVTALGMSEDEACRRIDLARLARKFPALFKELVTGNISLSVALLLKPVLSPENHRELIAAARGASLRTARELLAARFPRADVPDHVRKLPERAAPATSEPKPEIQPGLAFTPPSSPAVLVSEPAVSCAPLTADAVESVAAAKAPALPAAATPPHAPATMPTRAPATTMSPSTSAQDRGPSTAPNASAATTEALEPGSSPPLLLTRTKSSPGLEPTSTPTVSGAAPTTSRPRQHIEPLSPGRYRVQFTADASVKQKLELARDLLRHSEPSGDFALVVSRALELLIDQLMRRRFAVGCRPARSKPVERPVPSKPAESPTPSKPADGAAPSKPAESPTPSNGSAPSKLAGGFAPSKPAARPVPPKPAEGFAPSKPADQPASPPMRPAQPSAPTPPTFARCSKAPDSPCPQPDLPGAPERGPASSGRRPSRCSSAARRTVVQRDGLGCSWVDADGTRCGSTAWLEVDHRHPAAKGGSSDPDNLRLLCRAHNRLAAERAYGRAHVSRSIVHRQSSAASPPVQA